MRAAGESYTVISKELHISRSTCTKWARSLAADIEAAENEHKRELFTVLSLTAEKRIEKLGKTLQRLESALETKDFSNMTTARLLELYLRYVAAIAAEQPPKQAAITQPENTIEYYQSVYSDILRRSQAGEISAADAQVQLEIADKLLMLSAAADNRDNFGMEFLPEK